MSTRPPFDDEQGRMLSALVGTLSGHIVDLYWIDGAGLGLGREHYQFMPRRESEHPFWNIPDFPVSATIRATPILAAYAYVQLLHEWSARELT